jgi:hypothetical protein
MIRQQNNKKRQRDCNSERRQDARRGQKEPCDGVLVVTSREPQRRLTQMLIAGFTALEHPRSNRRQRAMSNRNQERHKYYEGEGGHGSKRDFLIYAIGPCTDRLSKEGGGEYATGRAATSCSTRSSSGQPQEVSSSGDGWTCQGTKRCSTTASSRTSLKGMASRRGEHRRSNQQIDMADREWVSKWQADEHDEREEAKADERIKTTDEPIKGDRKAPTVNSSSVRA